jgi:hypothetical protein
MKLWICLLLTIASLAAADRPAKKKAPAAAPKAKAAAPITIPPDAIEVETGTWAHTDAQGKKWRYRKTPFGVTRWEDKPGPAGNSEITGKVTGPPLESMTAVEDGEYLRFERPGPFGRYRWKRKKSELNAIEQAVWDRERDKAAGGKKDKPE